jgi:hypothetical protein
MRKTGRQSAQSQAAPSFLDQKAFAEFRAEELPAAAAAEITPVMALTRRGLGAAAEAVVAGVVVAAC